MEIEALLTEKKVSVLKAYKPEFRHYILSMCTARKSFCEVLKTFLNF